MNREFTNRPFNDYEPFPRAALDGSITARFEEIVRRFPNKLASSSTKYASTYEQLNAAANNVAHRIRAAKVHPNEPVLLNLRLDAPAIAAVIGVLKAGSFYCALDPALTRERMQSILKTLRPRMLICDTAGVDLSAELAGNAITLVNIDGAPEITRNAPFPSHVSPNALAYVFFTSGTTGQPKGVMDFHRNVLHNIFRYTNNLHISHEDRLSLLQPLSFSGSVSSLFCALLNGATVCPFDLRQEGSARLADWLTDQQITIYHSVPSLFRLIAAEGRRFSNLRIIRLEGDHASAADAALFQTHFHPSCLLVNGLGATECGIVRQYFLAKNAPLPTHGLPIGYPVEDMEISLLSDDGQLVPVGEVGEIVIKSRYLALGYWEQPELTAQAFTPALEDPQARIYRTGDLGRMDRDGCLEYLGRKDFQAKVRGQRVNLADVEAAFLHIDGVREAVATIRPDKAGENQIIVYYTASDGRTVYLDEVRRQVRDRLDDYSIPSILVRLDVLPVNMNGKVDRLALPEPVGQRTIAATSVAPSTQVELALANIWVEILDLDQVGVNDSFLHLGGDSLKIMRMLNRVNQLFGVNISMGEFFPSPTISSLERLLNNLPIGD